MSSGLIFSIRKDLLLKSQLLAILASKLIASLKPCLVEILPIVKCLEASLKILNIKLKSCFNGHQFSTSLVN